MTEAKRGRFGKKTGIIAGVVVAVLAVAGVGMFAWHEQPSFCAAICHTPMDEYLATYEQEPGTVGTDKWGNEVENTSAMLAVSHKAEADSTCLDCHVPTLSEQVSEGINWVTGNYTYPLEEKSLGDLTAASGADEDSFCLNEGCHDLTREELAATTSDMERNPHFAQHDELECSTCHKAHRASVMQCAQCHDDVVLPDGWVAR